MYLEGGDFMMNIHQDVFHEQCSYSYPVCVILGLDFWYLNQIIYQDLKFDNLLFDEDYLTIALQFFNSFILFISGPKRQSPKKNEPFMILDWYTLPKVASIVQH
jgi:serine/threonine protein kinase